MSRKTLNQKSKPKVTKPLKKQTQVIPIETPILQVTIAENAKVAEDDLFATAKHCANLGDVISIMAATKKCWEVFKKKIRICQMLDIPGGYYPGASHPTRSEDGTMVTMNKPMFEMIKPLVESQPYIHSFIPYNGQHIDLNFDVIRGQTDVGMPNFMIQSWIIFAFPNLDFDLSKTWIELPEVEDHPIRNQVDGKIILNFTERYRLPPTQCDYSFLQGYIPDLIFAGTEREHFLFCNCWHLDIPRLEVKDFLEYAYALKYARFLMSNQSMAWNLSFALGTPRILETCKWAANCQPFIGENSKGYMYTVGAEYYFRKFYNDTMQQRIKPRITGALQKTA
jgi:hypothetical protein